MKGQRSSNLELNDEDESDDLKVVSEERVRAPTLLSDDSDEDEVVITSGPPQLRPKVSPAKEPPTPTPQKDPAPQVILEDNDDDESCLMPAPGKLCSILPGFSHHTLQALRLTREELMLLQERSRATRQAQKRAEAVQSPLVLNTPNSSKAHGKSPLIEAEEKKKILIKVQNKDGEIQPFQMFTTDKFENLFRVYAEVFNLSLANLSFRFDGEQLAPNSTPKNHTMEGGELIEVYKI